MNNVKARQKIERMIVEKVVDDMLSAGFNIDVNDGEETTLKGSTNKGDIIAAMFTTDEDLLIVHRDKLRGWIRFIYGNDGYDVVNDYTVNLESFMKGANALSEEWG